jgi:hypothetical protein
VSPCTHFIAPSPQIQGQRVHVTKLEAERSALSRLDRIKADQGARATALEKEAGASELRANLIEYNLDAVDAALDAVNAGGASSVALYGSAMPVLCCTASSKCKTVVAIKTLQLGCYGCGPGCSDCRRIACVLPSHPASAVCLRVRCPHA